MLIALWVLNGLLALGFLLFGVTKLAKPTAALAESGMAWVNDFPAPAVKMIAVLEILGAIGLVVPLLTGIVPILTPLAAAGLAIIMIGAAVVHLRRQEKAIPAIPLAVLSIASVVLAFMAL